MVRDDRWPRSLAGRDVKEIISNCVKASVDICELEIAAPAELSVLLTNDKEQQALNKKWRSQDKTTNVLSFAQIEPFAPVKGLLGDVVLARETVSVEARRQQKTVADHLTHLVVHGFLHILGYDHRTESQTERMQDLEIRVLARLGVGDPYAKKQPETGVREGAPTMERQSRRY